MQREEKEERDGKYDGLSGLAGDLTFTASGFNEVDNLLFAELVYTSFDGIVTGQSEAEAVTLAEASAVFWEQNSREEILARVSMTKAAPFVLEKMAKTERFRDVKLWGYVNDISEEEQSQFAVMCAGLPDGSIYVSFRGTDNTITGWREDFNMGYLSETPGQLKAVSYVEQMLGDGSCPVRIGVTPRAEILRSMLQSTAAAGCRTGFLRCTAMTDLGSAGIL